MKKLGTWLVIFSGIIASHSAIADGSNTGLNAARPEQHWVTKFETAENGHAMRPEKNRTGKISREDLSAKDFPEGNWGQVTNGCQVSLRFPKRAFTNGEPIIGTVIVRNVTNQDVYYFYHPSGQRNGPVGYVVTTSSGRTLPNPDVSRFFQGGRTYTLEPGTQHRHLKDLSKDYHLMNGAYSVHAEICTLVFPPPIVDGKPKGVYAMVKSAEVPITIVATNLPSLDEK